MLVGVVSLLRSAGAPQVSAWAWASVPDWPWALAWETLGTCSRLVGGDRTGQDPGGSGLNQRTEPAVTTRHGPPKRVHGYELVVVRYWNEQETQNQIKTPLSPHRATGQCETEQ